MNIIRSRTLYKLFRKHKSPPTNIFTNIYVVYTYIRTWPHVKVKGRSTVTWDCNWSTRRVQCRKHVHEARACTWWTWVSPWCRGGQPSLSRRSPRGHSFRISSLDLYDDPGDRDCCTSRCCNHHHHHRWPVSSCPLWNSHSRINPRGINAKSGRSKLDRSGKNCRGYSWNR